MKWIDLSVDQKIQFKNSCDKQYGKTFVKCETGEPLYFDENSNLIDSQIVIDLMLDIKEN